MNSTQHWCSLLGFAIALPFPTLFQGFQEFWIVFQRSYSLRVSLFTFFYLVLSPQSSVLSPYSSVLSPYSSVLSPYSSVLSPQS
ncbi:hypothetical protein [Coleofasciculus sp. H7-2]|uniref:hypothetical protein n=1 Tax=Coleofasciculus sp. H7-2 TaxID=3351545 RepID=UPI00367294C6